MTTPARTVIVPAGVNQDGTRRLVELDPYAPNPLLDLAQMSNPALVAVAQRDAPPPSLFESGDLPPFTASGVDPEQLNQLPYTARHSAATNPSPAAFLDLIEQAAGDPDFTVEHVGLEAYRTRISRWLAGHDKPPTSELSTSDGDALYDQLFPSTPATPDAAPIRAGYGTPAAPAASGSLTPGLGRRGGRVA